MGFTVQTQIQTEDEREHVVVYLNEQLAGEVAACKAGQISTEEEEEKAERHGLFHFTVPIGLIELPIDGCID